MASEAKITIKLIDQFSKAAKDFKSLNNEFKNLEKIFKQSDFTSGIKALSKAMLSLRGDIEKTTSSYKNFQSQSSKTPKTPLSPRGISGNANNAYGSYLGSGVAFYSSLNMVKTAADIEKGKIEIDKVIRGNEALNRPAYYKIAEDMVRAFGVSFEEAFEQVGRSYKFAPGEGFAKQEATKMLSEATLIASKVFDMPIIGASESLAALISKFQIPMSQIKHTIAMINDMANAFGAVPDRILLRSLGRLPAVEGLDITSAAFLLGLSRQATSMEASGVSSSTYKMLNKLPIFNFLKTTEERDLTTEEQKTFVEEIKSFDKFMQSSVVTYFTQNAGSWAKMNTEQKNEFLKKYKITDIREVNTTKGILDMISSTMANPKGEASTQVIAATKILNKYGLKGLSESEILKKVSEGNAEYIMLVKSLTDNLGIVYDIYGQQLRGISGKLGTSVLKIMQNNVGDFQKLTESVNEFIGSNQGVAGNVLLFVGGMAGLSLAFKTLAFTFGGYIALISAAKTAMLGFALANPLSATIIAVVAGVIALGTLIYKYWDNIMTFLKKEDSNFNERLNDSFNVVGVFKKAGKEIKENLRPGILENKTTPNYSSDYTAELLGLQTRKQIMENLLSYNQPENAKMQTSQTIDIKVSAEPGTNVEQVTVENNNEPRMNFVPSNFTFNGRKYF